MSTNVFSANFRPNPSRDSGLSPAASTSTSPTAASPHTSDTLLRLPALTGTRAVHLQVTDMGDATWEVSHKDAIIGFIRQAGRVFVSLPGDRLDLAEESGQFQRWDGALTALMNGSGYAAARRTQQPEQRGTNGRSGWPNARGFVVSTMPEKSTESEVSPAAESGDLLMFHPKDRTHSAKPAREPIVTEINAAVIMHGGREFHTTRARAESFLIWARAVVESGQAALVPLLHNDGVDLLLITDKTPVESSKHWP